eukprot:1776474-Amphidinium_carterae.1
MIGFPRRWGLWRTWGQILHTCTLTSALRGETAGVSTAPCSHHGQKGLHPCLGHCSDRTRAAFSGSCGSQTGLAMAERSVVEPWGCFMPPLLRSIALA